MKKYLILVLTALLLLASVSCGKEKKVFYVRDGGEVTKEGQYTLYVDFCEIKDIVKAPYADEVYYYFEVDDGKVYIDFCIAYTNLTSKNILAEEVITSAKLTYYDKYEYSSRVTIEVDSRSDFDYADETYIVPLAKEYLHCLFEVPTDVVEGRGSIVITFTVAKSAFSYEVIKDAQ